MRPRLPIPVPSVRPRLRALIRSAVGAAVALVVGGASPADAQDVRYTVAPRVLHLQWDDGLAFDRVTTAGLSVIVDFGTWVALEAHAAAGRDINARFSQAGLVDTLGAPASDAALDLSRFGLAMRINGGTSRVVPFARAGGDVLRFDSPDGRVVRTVALHYGGGVRTTLGARWRAELFAEELRLRVDRSQLAPGVAAGTDPDAANRRRNLGLGASLGYAFGGSTSQTEGRPRFRLVSVPIEAFAGRLRLADAAIPEATVAGVRLGVEVGQNVGVHAYHLRRVGTHDEVEGMVSSTGVEMKFNLNAVPRLAPYFIVGGGQLDFSSDFRDATGQPRTDHGVLILGGGIGLRVNDQFRFNAAIRDLIHAGDDPLNAAGSTSELRHVVLLTAGMAFNIGRTRRGGISLVRDTTAAPTTRRARAADTPTDAPADAPAGAAPRAVADSGAVAARDSMPPAVRNHQSDRLVTIPLPLEGELYVRYGPVDTARLRGVRAQESRMDTLLIQELVRREVERLVAGRMAAPTAAPAAAPAAAPIILQPPTVIVQRDAPAAARPATPIPVAGDTAAVRRLAAERDQARAELAGLRERLTALEAALAAPPATPPAAVPPAAIEEPRPAAEPGGADLARRRQLLDQLRTARPTDVEVVEHARGLVVKMGGGLFGSEVATFETAGRVVVALVAALAEAYPNATVAVEGHTDALGDERYNQELSERRADFVRNALVRAGVAPRRVSVAGFGPHHPVGDNATAAGRARNRRVEVVLVGAVSPPPATP